MKTILSPFNPKGEQEKELRKKESFFSVWSEQNNEKNEWKVYHNIAIFLTRKRKLKEKNNIFSVHFSLQNLVSCESVCSRCICLAPVILACLAIIGLSIGS